MASAERIGPYQLVREIGRGGMGIVWLAHDERLDRPVALKLIREADEQGRRRFRREARLGASVSHPNICPIYEVGEEEGVLFIAMEHLEGESLSERVRKGPLPLLDAVQVALGVLSALEALHARGLVHATSSPPTYSRRRTE